MPLKFLPPRHTIHRAPLLLAPFMFRASLQPGDGWPAPSPFQLNGGKTSHRSQLSKLGIMPHDDHVAAGVPPAVEGGVSPPGPCDGSHFGGVSASGFFP